MHLTLAVRNFDFQVLQLLGEKGGPGMVLLGHPRTVSASQLTVPREPLSRDSLLSFLPHPSLFFFLLLLTYQVPTYCVPLALPDTGQDTQSAPLHCVLIGIDTPYFDCHPTERSYRFWFGF